MEEPTHSAARPTAPSAPPTTPPATPPHGYSARLDRDDRIRILTLRDAGFTYQRIVEALPNVTHRQVQYTCQAQVYTPRKARGKPPKLSDSDVNGVLAFISSSEENRRMPYGKVIKKLNLNVSNDALSRALRKRGYQRSSKAPSSKSRKTPTSCPGLPTRESDNGAVKSNTAVEINPVDEHDLDKTPDEST